VDGQVGEPCGSSGFSCHRDVQGEGLKGAEMSKPIARNEGRAGVVAAFCSATAPLKRPRYARPRGVCLITSASVPLLVAAGFLGAGSDAVSLTAISPSTEQVESGSKRTETFCKKLHRRMRQRMSVAPNSHTRCSSFPAIWVFHPLLASRSQWRPQQAAEISRAAG
jgi:hypothetical protein